MPSETDFDAVDRDQLLRQVLGVGDDFEYEILGKEDWIGRRLLADKFRERRVFICGDAAHIWVPFAGYGMNAGIADAMNLSWMLAGVLHGWADAGHPRMRTRRNAGRSPSRFALCDEHGVAACATARRGARRTSRTRGRRATRCVPNFGRTLVDREHAAILLWRIEFRLFLRTLADHRL